LIFPRLVSARPLGGVQETETATRWPGRAEQEARARLAILHEELLAQGQEMRSPLPHFLPKRRPCNSFDRDNADRRPAPRQFSDCRKCQAYYRAFPVVPSFHSIDGRSPRGRHQASERWRPASCFVLTFCKCRVFAGQRVVTCYLLHNVVTSRALVQSPKGLSVSNGRAI
jgi:hypothetical protein